MVPHPSAAVATAVNGSEGFPGLPAASTGKATPGKWGSKGRSAANAPATPAATGQIQMLKEMGFSEEQSRQALAECVWDVNKALDLLFTRGVPMNGEGGGAAPDADSGSASTSAAASEVRSPEPSSGKARHEGVASSGNSPAGADSAEQSTTASTASSPRSLADKMSANSAAVSASVTPLSPQSPADASGANLATAVEEEPVAEVVAEVAAASEEQADAAVIEQLLEKDVIQVACTEVSPTEDTAEVETVPVPKQLTRISKSWEMEGAGAQLCVQEGDFVSVWQSSVTEHGWIYAEDPSCAEKAGWLPGCILEELPSHQVWIRATQNMEAAHETQLLVTEGAVYKVDVDTRTKEGWIYAEASGVTTESEGDASVQQAGWVPTFCFGDALQ